MLVQAITCQDLVSDRNLNLHTLSLFGRLSEDLQFSYLRGRKTLIVLLELEALEIYP